MTRLAPTIYSHAHVLLLDDERVDVTEQKTGWIDLRIKNGNAEVLIAMKREAAARLLADLSAVVTLAEMADMEPQKEAVNE